MKKQVLEFLEQLKMNNNRDWFHLHKQEYEEAKEELMFCVNSVIPLIAKFDETVRFVEAKDCLFRIFRDVRFSHDKSPYKTNMGAWITHLGRKSPGPGYYIHLQPGESFLAAGVYMPDPGQLKKIRKEIFYNADEFKSILNNNDIRKLTTGLADMDKVKLAPRDFPKDFADIDLLKYRHYTISHVLTREMILSDDFSQYAVAVFKAMSRLNTFLRRALET